MAARAAHKGAWLVPWRVGQRLRASHAMEVGGRSKVAAQVGVPFMSIAAGRCEALFRQWKVGPSWQATKKVAAQVANVRDVKVSSYRRNLAWS